MSLFLSFHEVVSVFFEIEKKRAYYMVDAIFSDVSVSEAGVWQELREDLFHGLQYEEIRKKYTSELIFRGISFHECCTTWI